MYNSAPTSTTTLSGPSTFYAIVGVLYNSGTDLLPENVSPTNANLVGGALPITVTSGTPSVGELQTGTTNTASETISLPAGDYYAGQSGGGGPFTFVPLTDGTTTLSISGPGLTAASTNYGPGSVQVTVSMAALTFQSGVIVGSGLQYQMTGYLQAANDGGVTIRVASSDATKLLVSPDATTAGTPFVDIFVANGASSYNFYVQGVSGATGTVTLTASTADTSFETGTVTVSVVEPQLVFYTGLPSSEAATSADAPFEVATYLSSFGYESVAAGGSLVVTLSSTNTAAADLTTSSQTQTSPVTVTIPAGAYTSPSAVAGGGVSLHAVGTGSTIINATGSGVISASQTVTLN
jgi:hypothetical protein